MGPTQALCIVEKFRTNMEPNGFDLAKHMSVVHSHYAKMLYARHDPRLSPAHYHVRPGQQRLNPRSSVDGCDIEAGDIVVEVFVDHDLPRDRYRAVMDVTVDGRRLRVGAIDRERATEYGNRFVPAGLPKWIGWDHHRLTKAVYADVTELADRLLGQLRIENRDDARHP